MIFYATKLDKNFKFSFNNEFEEINIKSTDKTNLHGLLFKAKKSKEIGRAHV